MLNATRRLKLTGSTSAEDDTGSVPQRKRPSAVPLFSSALMSLALTAQQDTVAEARGLLRAVHTRHPTTQRAATKGPGRKPRFIYELKGEASLSGLIAGLISASSVVGPTQFDRTYRIQVRDSLRGECPPAPVQLPVLKTIVTTKIP